MLFSDAMRTVEVEDCAGGATLFLRFPDAGQRPFPAVCWTEAGPVTGFRQRAADLESDGDFTGLRWEIGPFATCEHDSGRSGKEFAHDLHSVANWNHFPYPNTYGLVRYDGRALREYARRIVS